MDTHIEKTQLFDQHDEEDDLILPTTSDGNPSASSSSSKQSTTSVHADMSRWTNFDMLAESPSSARVVVDDMLEESEEGLDQLNDLDRPPSSSLIGAPSLFALPQPMPPQSPAAAHSASILTAAVADCDAAILDYEAAADADNKPPRRPRGRCRFADHHASYDIRI